MKTKIIFFVVSFYILTAFLWWGYSLINLRILEANNEKKNLYELAENCKHQVIDSLQKKTDNFLDSDISAIFIQIDKKQLFNLNILSKESSKFNDDLDNYIQVFPRPEILLEKGEYLKRKITQYIGEGVFFIILLVWGMILLYRNFMGQLKLKQQQNNFILAVTHELKTPVAGIKLMLQTLQKRTISDEYKAELSSSAVVDIERLEMLVENVLLASKIDNFKYDFHFEEFDLVEILEESISRFERMNLKGHYFRLICDTGTFKIFADKFAMATVFDNLISNSVKYSPDASEIRLNIKEQDNHIMVMVIDTANTIPVVERQHIFTKFYRIGNEQTRTSKGTGLGLYIVKQILDQHHGTITITEKGGGIGNIFKVMVPKVSQK